MTDYTPTTEVVRHAVSYPRERLGEPLPIKPEAFDRWLEQVKAKAWDEGHDAGWASRHEDALIAWVPSDPLESDARNPYRQEKEA